MVLIVIDIGIGIEASELVCRRCEARHGIHGAIDETCRVRAGLGVERHHAGQAVEHSCVSRVTRVSRSRLVDTRLRLHLRSRRRCRLGSDLGLRALPTRTLGRGLRLGALRDSRLLRGAVGRGTIRGTLVEAELLFDLAEADLPMSSIVSN